MKLVQADDDAEGDAGAAVPVTFGVAVSGVFGVAVAEPAGAELAGAELAGAVLAGGELVLGAVAGGEQAASRTATQNAAETARPDDPIVRMTPSPWDASSSTIIVFPDAKNRAFGPLAATRQSITEPERSSQPALTGR
ncbi:hypothetical protein ABIB26_000972 [Arthrobacter sp. UYEF20]